MKRACRNFLGATFPPFNEAGLAPWTIRDRGQAAIQSGTRWKLTDELNVLALVKGAEHYIFIYDDASRPQLIDNFRDLAADPQVNLSWFDAMVLTTKAREQQESGVGGQESGLEGHRRFSDS